MVDQINDTSEVHRQAPVPYSFSKPFWEAARDRRLMLQYCPKTEQFQFYPKPCSTFTGRRDLEWREVSGKGEIYTYTVATIARTPFDGSTPFFIATVTLDEGVNILANVVGCAADQMAIGMRVRATWLPLPGDGNLLVFEPDALIG